MKQVIFWLLLVLPFFFCSCEKEAKQIGPGWGRVLQINSNTPVPDAIVVFSETTNPYSWAGNQSREVWRDTTDENGVFQIPNLLNFSAARAYGLRAYYPDPSDVTGCDFRHREGSEVLYLYLRPRAWLKVLFQNEQILNLDIVHAELKVNGQTALIQPTGRIYQLTGNETPKISYRFMYRDESGTLLWTDRTEVAAPRLAPLDTTNVVIHY